MYEQTKTCTKCGETKPLSEFYDQKLGTLGKHSRCKPCERSRAKEYAARNPDGRAERGRRWRAANLERQRELCQKWWAANPGASAEYARRRRRSPQVRLENSIRWRLWNELKPGSKQGRKTFDLLGYNGDDLKRHIDALLKPGMTWDNYAHDTWHIDHIRPLSSFEYETPDDPDFRRAWALTNLQPLWAEDNHSKGPRFGHPSQEGLSLAA